MSEGASKSGILRAVIEYDDRTEIRCAVDLEPESVFVLTDAAPAIGTAIALELSFPSLLEPVAIAGEAVQVKVKEYPGVQCGFVCRLDAQARPALEIERLAKLPVRGARRLDVLLVEANRLVRDMFAYTVKRYFEGRPGTVRLETAHDSMSAWDKLASAAFDVVLVDYLLKDEDGATLIERIRASRTLQRTPIVAVGLGTTDARVATLSAGADLFLEKPLVLKDLFRTFELLMARKDDDGRPT